MLHRVGLRPARGSERKGKEDHAEGGGQREHEVKREPRHKINSQIKCARHLTRQA